MITITKGLSGTYFSATVPDFTFGIGGAMASVVITLDSDEIYSENLFPIGGSISLRDLSDLVRPYAKARLVTEMKVTVTEKDGDGNSLGNAATASCSVVYCEADIDMDASDWCDTHFLTLLQGARLTAIGRLEYLHYTGTEAAAITATYKDGSVKTFQAVVIGGNSKYTTIDVSPSRYVSDSPLISYTVKAGKRSQMFNIDFNNPDCAPILIFDNSFGCEELLYCTGEETLSSGFKYDTAFIEGKNTNYKVTETTSFKADTGPLTFAMADWCRELFRSQYVRIVNFVGGTPQVGKEMVVSDPKVEYSNMTDELPSITFTIQYAQKNHNVIQTEREGRIFDNTFDYTFN